MQQNYFSGFKSNCHVTLIFQLLSGFLSLWGINATAILSHPHPLSTSRINVCAVDLWCIRHLKLTHSGLLYSRYTIGHWQIPLGLWASPLFQDRWSLEWLVYLCFIAMHDCYPLIWLTSPREEGLESLCFPLFMQRSNQHNRLLTPLQNLMHVRVRDWVEKATLFVLAHFYGQNNAFLFII